MKITEYGQKKTLLDSDLLLVDGPEGTSSITAENLASELKKRNEIKNTDQLFDWLDTLGLGIQIRNNLYRGKNLGSSLTKEQAKNIVNGSFKDMFIGDYWLIDGIQYIIANFNYWTGVNRHIVLFTTRIGVAPFDDSGSLSKGYLGSSLYTSGHNGANDVILKAFHDSDILSHYDVISASFDNTNGITGVYGGQFKILLPNQIMMTGTSITAPPLTTSINNYEVVDYDQLRVCAMVPRTTSNGGDMWLRDVATTNQAIGVLSVNGQYRLRQYTASANLGFRLVFGLTGEATAS